MEERGAAKGKLASRNAHRTQGRESAVTSLERVGRKATKDKDTKFSNLMCHIKAPLLEKAYQRLSKHAATGVDRMTWDEYGKDLPARLADLQDRIHRGSYHPLPVRRVYIPKAGGGERPLGIPALEDKIVQQAVRTILEPIYEAEFLGFSYGFRPRRSAHDALDALATVIIKKRTNWVLDADIRNFFDSVDHEWMKKFLEHRIGDRRLVRLLMKWLKAGVMESEQWHETAVGTPQGGIISPLLANIYLHYVLDLWVESWRKRIAREVYYVRYADDLVMAFEDRQDAIAARDAMSRRLLKFGLKLHPEKTRVLRFGRFAARDCARFGDKLQTFEFLGFTHIASRDGKHGWFLLKRITCSRKRSRKAAEVYKELRRRRHDDAVQTHAWLSSLLRGYYEYFAVPTNIKMLQRFRDRVGVAWLRQLRRRSQKGRYWSTTKIRRFEHRFPLPRPSVRHPWPQERFAAR
jgi:group II intron reverse transcriptase/maturase